MNSISQLSFITILLSYICMSCGSEHSQVNDGQLCPYNISLDSAKESDKCVLPVKVIPLITDNHVIIDDITKFIVSNGDMYIFDRKMQCIHIFDSIGHQKKIINHHGAGPGEYINANDISLDENNDLYVADIETQRIIRYTYPDYSSFTVYPLERAFTNFDISKDYLYISNLAEGHNLSIKLAARPIDNDSLRVLSRASVKDEYRAAGAGRTHLWKSDSTLLFYDRFTPYIYRLVDGDIEGVIMFNESDIPDERLINELISLPAPHRYTKLSEPTEKILDISSCFETSKYILMEVRTSPLKFLVLDKESGDYSRLPTLLTDDIRSSIGLLGAHNDYFITATTGDENTNPEIVFFKIKDKLDK